MRRGASCRVTRGPGNSYFPGPHLLPPGDGAVGPCWGMETDGVTVREARPSDAFSVGALHIQDEREQGHAVPPGYLDALSDAWLRDRARRTWVAEDDAAGRSACCTAPGAEAAERAPAGRRLVPRQPGLRHPGRPRLWHRRRLLEALIAWAETDGVTRVQLNSVPEARTLYERMGFGPPSERLMELRVSDRTRRWLPRSPSTSPGASDRCRSRPPPASCSRASAACWWRGSTASCATSRTCSPTATSSSR